jgi:acyl-CoA reductase-like NAD-dependent aldehyde dehydrogenase
MNQPRRSAVALRHVAFENLGLLAPIMEGGVKESGYGREGGTEGLQCYTVTKNVSHKVLA